MADCDVAKLNIDLKCNVCSSINNLKRCARCKKVVYCSREHQVSDWAAHKYACSQINKQNTNNCDGNVSVSGIQNMDTENPVSIGNVESLQKDDNETEFDNRPFIKLQFRKPKRTDTYALAKFVIEKLYKIGYCVIDGVFENRHLINTLEEVHSLDESHKMQPGKLAGGRTGSEESEKVVNSNIRSDKLVWLEGKEKQYPNICKVIETMDTVLTNLNQFMEGQHNIKRRTKAMVACYSGNGTYYRRHVDNPKKDGRLITCILYLNKDWDVQKYGGLLRIFPEGTDRYVDIPPLLNRLLFFWSDLRNPHEVQPAFRNRYAITVWYFDEKERSAAEDQTHESMEQIYGELALLEIATKKKEKEEIENKIETETHKVLGSLSDDELDAMTALLEGHANPKGMLQSLGISPILQDKLMEILKTRKAQ